VQLIIALLQHESLQRHARRQHKFLLAVVQSCGDDELQQMPANGIVGPSRQLGEH
jgi:hypothetical protein